MCTIVQSFTPIGATVAEIYVTVQRNSSILTATDVPFHTPLRSVRRTINTTGKNLIPGGYVWDIRPPLVFGRLSLCYDDTLSVTISTLQENGHNCRLLHAELYGLPLPTFSLSLVVSCNVSFGARGFRSAAPAIWNSLPSNVCSCETPHNIPPTPEISSFPFSLCHCVATHLSPSDSFSE